MSSEQLVYDVEKANKIVVIREPAQKNNHWKCLSICSFLLLIGAVTVFALLQLGAFGSSENQDSKVHGNSFSDHLPATMKVQALRSRKPAAHAVASSHNTKQLNWTTEVIPTFQENGMQLDKSENAFVVPSTGLYFVYSQLLFHNNNCKKLLLLTHSITCWSSEISVEVELLKSIKSVLHLAAKAPGSLPTRTLSSFYILLIVTVLHWQRETPPAACLPSPKPKTRAVSQPPPG